MHWQPVAFLHQERMHVLFDSSYKIFNLEKPEFRCHAEKTKIIWCLTYRTYGTLCKYIFPLLWLLEHGGADLFRPNWNASKYY